MTESVKARAEVSLGGVRYPIEGFVRPQIISRFPGKISIGDSSYDNEQVLSNWMISDQRGGIGVEEMDESVHADRCWWSTCDLDHNGHILPPPLATSISAIGNKVSPTGHTDPDGVWTNETNAYDGDWTTYASGSLDAGGAAWDSYLQLSVASMSVVGVAIKVGRSGPTVTQVDVDYYDGSWHDLYSGGIPANMLVCPHVLAIAAANVTQIRVRFYKTSAVAVAAYIYEAYFIGTTASHTTFRTCNFNSNLYFGINDILCKLNTTTGATLTPIAIFPANITDLVSTVGNQMCILLGDSDEFWYMGFADSTINTNEALDATETDITCGADATDDIPVGSTIKIENEQMYVSATGVTLTVTRGYHGTSAVTHATAKDIYIGEQLTETDEIGAYWGLHWDNKFFWIDSVGAQISYTATLAATIVETDNGVIPDGAAVNGLMVYQDTNGDDIIYAGTKTKFWAHDYANAKFLATKLDFAEHPNACKGMVNWNTDAFISMGLHVKKYSVGASVATASSVGLDRDDGLPAEYNGEFVAFIKDSEQFYALVDATQLGHVDDLSWVAKYNGVGWQCLWATGTVNQAMHGGIVSTAYSRRLWFDCGNTIYYIPLQRTKLLPKKNSDYTYAASAIHIMPWMDGGTKVFDKLARACKRFCKDLTADETVIIKYRVDKATTAIASTWTTLATLNADDNGETSTNFETTASTGDGKVYNCIQFRFDLARGATTTNAPDLQALILSFMKVVDPKWAWSFTVNCAEYYAGKTPRQLVSALETAAATQTLLEFTFRESDSHYVKISPYNGMTPTGDAYEGKYNITVIEP